MILLKYMANQSCYLPMIIKEPISGLAFIRHLRDRQMRIQKKGNMAGRL